MSYEPLYVLGWAILASFLWDEIAGVLNLLYKRIIRLQAAKMGTMAERCEEEWLADLAETRGVLLQLCFVLGTVFAPINTRLEMSESFSGGRWRFIAAFALRNASWLAAFPALWLIATYPPHPSRYTAYLSLGSVMMLWVCWFAAPVHRVSARLYGKLNYEGRLIVGGMVLPMAIGFAFLASVPSPTARTHPMMQLGPQNVQKKFEVIYVSPDFLEFDRIRPRRSDVNTQPVSDGVDLLPGLVSESAAAKGNPAPLSISGVKHLYLFEQLLVPLPEQPTTPDLDLGPTPPTRVVPGTPTGLRITSGGAT